MYPHLNYEHCDNEAHKYFHPHCRPVQVLYNAGTVELEIGGKKIDGVFSGNIFDNGFMNGNITYVTIDENNNPVTHNIPIASQYTNTTEINEKKERVDSTQEKITLDFKDTFKVSDGNNNFYDVVCTRTESKINQCCEAWEHAIEMHNIWHNHHHHHYPNDFMPPCNHHHHHEHCHPQYPYPTPRNWFPNHLPFNPHSIPYLGGDIHWLPNPHGYGVIKIDNLPPHYVDMGEQPIYNDIYCW